MNSQRLLSIAKFIDNNDRLIDVGCDHGYLGIYLKSKNICEEVLLTDVSNNALNVAINNIKKYNLNIKTFLTNGLENIDLNDYNTISISGMGTHSIINILNVLKNNKSIKKLILQSNNNLDILRKEISNLGYYLDDEITVFENNKYYIICKFLKGNKKISESEISFGLLKSDKISYYNYLLDNYNNYIKNIVNKKDQEKIQNKIDILTKLLKECR